MMGVMGIEKQVNLQNEVLPPGDIANQVAAQDTSRTAAHYP